MIEFRLLGSLDLKGPEGTLRSVLAQPKRVALLAYLAAATPNGFHRRDKLLGLFWPESDQEHGRGSLRKALYLLRQSLGEEVIVSRGDEEIGLAEGALWCDAVAFEEALEAGSLEEALDLYRGDLLEGFFISEAPEFERWLEGERERLRVRASEAAWSLAEQEEADGSAVRAASWAKKAVSSSPHDEGTLRRLLQLLDRVGDRAGAVKEYEGFARRLKVEYEIEPSPETQALIAAIREREVAAADGSIERPLKARGGARAVAPGPVALAPAREREGGRLAVLPFANVGDDPEREYFADGITGEIINHLGRVAELKVISRTSIMPYKNTDKSLPQIAGELGVATVVEGEVLRIGNRVRISAQLIDAGTDTHLWADRYERQLADIIEVQGDIAKRIVAALQLTLTPEARERIERKPTEDLEAYDYYLLGRHRWARRGAQNLREAIRFFEAAIERDSNFALAWTGLAFAWIGLPFFEPIRSQEAHARAREAAQRALDLDDGLAEVHAVLGALAIHYEWDWDRAEIHLQRAVKLNPSYADAHHQLGNAQRGLGRLDEAIRSTQEGINLNPLTNSYNYHLALTLYDAGRVEEALEVFTKAEQREPPVVWGLQFMSMFLIHQRQAPEAFRVVRKWGDLVGFPDPERLHVVLEAVNDSTYTHEALAVLEDLRLATGLRAGDLSLFYLNLDAPAETLRVVRESIAERHPYVPWFGKSVWTRGRLLENPEIVAELQAAGVRIHDWTSDD